MWIGIVALGIGFVFLQTYRAREARLQREAEERNDLQLWEGESYASDDCYGTKRIHFPSMLFEYKFDCAGTAETYRLYHMRRKGDGTWEQRLTAESAEMELGESDRFFFEDNQAAYRNRLREEGAFWHPYEDPTIETAYQRFIHAQNIRVYSIEEGWRAKELKALEAFREEQRKAQEPPKSLATLKVEPPRPADFSADKAIIAGLIEDGAIETAREMAKQKGLMGTFEDLMCARN